MRVPQWVAETRLLKASVLPADVEEKLDEWVEDLQQVTFSLIATKLEGLGYEPSGDMMPHECDFLDSIFEAFIRAMARNDNTIGLMQPQD